MNFITILKTVISIIPTIIQLIDTLEAAFPQSGKGAAKLDIVKSVLQGSVEISEDVENGQFDGIWNVVTKVIGAVVALRKA